MTTILYYMIDYHTIIKIKNLINCYDINYKRINIKTITYYI